MTQAPIFAGTSGWAYATWKPGFYPAGVSSKKFLSYYASQLNSVEVNYTFRKLPTPEMLTGWLGAVPDGFRFSFKAPQRITHFSRLRETDDLVAEFVAALKPVAKASKLGVLLFQLPPNFKADQPRLAAFLKTRSMHGLHIGFEFRHESWFCNEIYDTLRERDAALCIAEGDELKTPKIHTSAAFTCFRLRRSGGYKATELAAFAKQQSALAAAGREVYSYFRHEDEPTGALNAAAFLERVAAIEGGS